MIFMITSVLFPLGIFITLLWVIFQHIFPASPQTSSCSDICARFCLWGRGGRGCKVWLGGGTYSRELSDTRKAASQLNYKKWKTFILRFDFHAIWPQWNVWEWISANFISTFGRTAPLIWHPEGLAVLIFAQDDHRTAIFGFLNKKPTSQWQ